MAENNSKVPRNRPTSTKLGPTHHFYCSLPTVASIRQTTNQSETYLVDLRCQFSCPRYEQSLCLFPGTLNALQSADAKGACSPRSTLGLNHHISSLHYLTEGTLLNQRRFLETCSPMCKQEGY
uniref:Uncharacterized protein n=1 Tax=Mesocestoides corti TaxID=53468 RepID=A0A5K3G0S5_MESCO